MTTIALVLWCVAYAGAEAKRNHLAGSTSPYLKRASGQPVDWYAIAFQMPQIFCFLLDTASLILPETHEITVCFTATGTVLVRYLPIGLIVVAHLRFPSYPFNR